MAEELEQAQAENERLKADPRDATSDATYYRVVWERREALARAQARVKVLELAAERVVRMERNIQHPFSWWMVDLEAALAEGDADADRD